MAKDNTDSAKVDAIVADIGKELAPLVDKIESDPHPTTQHSYGRYMAVLAQLGEGDRDMIGIVALALMKVGANKAGVRWAYRLSV